MIPWRVARSLLKLRDQTKAAHPAMPNPGFIGDADHASRDSDHNPWIDDPAGDKNVVSAGDWYNKGGLDSSDLAEALRRSRDPRLKYVISDGRIFRAYDKVVDGRLVKAWTWARYKGPNPHTGHCHVSVVATKSLYDSTRPWALTAATPPKGYDDVISPEQMTDLKNYIDASTNASARRWALWIARYELQTEDEKKRAAAAYDAVIAKGGTTAEAQAAMSASLKSLDLGLKADQERPA